VASVVLALVALAIAIRIRKDTPLPWVLWGATIILILFVTGTAAFIFMHEIAPDFSSVP
jgi:hypothetical protein